MDFNSLSCSGIYIYMYKFPCIRCGQSELPLKMQFKWNDCKLWQLFRGKYDLNRERINQLYGSSLCVSAQEKEEEAKYAQCADNNQSCIDVRSQNRFLSGRESSRPKANDESVALEQIFQYFVSLVMFSNVLGVSVKGNLYTFCFICRTIYIWTLYICTFCTYPSY